jgi:hypothetical protein
LSQVANDVHHAHPAPNQEGVERVLDRVPRPPFPPMDKMTLFLAADSKGNPVALGTPDLFISDTPKG